MLITISFTIKLIIASFLGMFLVYLNQKYNKDNKIVTLSLLTAINTVVIMVANSLANGDTSIFFLATIFLTHSISKTYKLHIIIFYFLTCVVALSVGEGYIIESILLCFIVFTINNNSRSIELFFVNNDAEDDTGNKEKEEV